MYICHNITHPDMRAYMYMPVSVRMFVHVVFVGVIRGGVATWGTYARDTYLAAAPGFFISDVDALGRGMTCWADRA